MSTGPLNENMLDHVGIAVSNAEAALAHYAGALGGTVVHTETLANFGVKAVFVKFAGTTIELLEPLGNTGPIAKFLATRGPGLHHLCFAVNDVRAELSRLSELGYRLIDKEPRRGAWGHQVAFLHPATTEGVLIELCQH